MIIKDLWIINNSGHVLYHYTASFSDYRIDEELFGGFISALSIFTSNLTQSQISFLKMQEDEMYFFKIEGIIVVSIMNSAGAEQDVIDQILGFVGDKFLEYYKKEVNNPNFNWNQIKDDFRNEIEFVTGDEQLYEEMKREMINKLFNEILQGTIPPDILHWKIAHLFSSSTSNEIRKIIDIIDGLLKISPTMNHDMILASKITNAFHRARNQLQIKLLHQKNQLLVLCNDESLFQKILKNFLIYGTLCIKIDSFAGLEAIVKSIEKWIKIEKYNILITEPQKMITAEQLTNILDSNSTNQIFLWSNEMLPEDILKLESNHKINFYIGNCQFDYGCPKIFKIINKFEFNPGNEQINIILE